MLVLGAFNFHHRGRRKQKLTPPGSPSAINMHLVAHYDWGSGEASPTGHMLDLGILCRRPHEELWQHGRKRAIGDFCIRVPYKQGTEDELASHALRASKNCYLWWNIFAPLIVNSVNSVIQVHLPQYCSKKLLTEQAE